jgi:U3 small nucleolar RNA-associated protein 20
LLQKLTHDLRSVLSPKYLDITTRLTGLLPRSLSAPTFTALLETFSSIFKYLLIPSTEDNSVSLTWQRMHDVLPKANVEVQRAMAEVWGATLRRLKGARRQEALEALASELNHVEDFAAWVLVFACKVSKFWQLWNVIA